MSHRGKYNLDAAKLKLRTANLDNIPILEGSFVQGGAIDEGAIGAKLVFEANDISTGADEEGKVMSRDLGVLQNDIAGGVCTDGVFSFVEAEIYAVGVDSETD
jgi:hypothetical protein